MEVTQQVSMTNKERLAQLVRQSTEVDRDHVLYHAALTQAEEAHRNIRQHLVTAAMSTGMSRDRANDIIGRAIAKAAQA